MMGKIIGIAAVSLTQFLMWIVHVCSIYCADCIHSARHDPAGATGQSEYAQHDSEHPMAFKILEFKNVFSDVNWVCFGFVSSTISWRLSFYSALFAAVGSVVNEDPQEAQALMLPITMPLFCHLL
jgi:ABC-2 type transport system permease protein